MGSLVPICAAAATVVALVDAAIVILGYQGGRPSDIGYAWLANTIGLATQWELLGWLPAAFRRYREVEGTGDAAGFLGAAVMLNFLLALLVGALIAAVALVRRRSARPASQWKPALLWGVWCLLLSPLVLHLASQMTLPGLTREQSMLEIWAGVGVVGLVWIVGAWPVSRLRWFGRLSQIGAWTLTAVGLVVVLGGAVSGSGAKEAVPAADASRPNVLLVSIDTLRADHVHSYGYERETTPNLDALAAEGALFRWTVAPTSWTLPSHMTMMTSLPPHQHQVTSDISRLGSRAVTLAEVFRDAGYATAGYVSGTYLQAEYGFRQGFEHYDDYTAMPKAWEAHSKVTSPEVMREAKRWLEDWDRNGRERPFFLFIHLWDVHYDYNPPSPYNTLFDPDYTGTITGRNFEGASEVRRGMDPRDLEHIIALYDGEIRYVDEQLGELFDFMCQREMLDGSVVTVTGDHGEEFFEHGQKGHRNALYDESVLVPLIVRYPAGVPAGRRIEAQVRLLDLAPTLLSLAGVEAPDGFGMTTGNPEEFGQDLTARITGDDITTPPLAYGVLSWKIASARSNDWKLIVQLQGSPAPELYDLLTDPGEQENKSAQETVRLDALYNDLTQFRKSRQQESLVETIKIDREQLAALRTLGYVTDYIEEAVSIDVKMTPEPESNLDSDTVQFQWKPNTKVDQYYLKVGSAVNTDDIYASDQGSATAVSVSGIPIDGRTIFVTLFMRTGEEWHHEGFSYGTGERKTGAERCTAKVSITNLSRDGKDFHVGDRFRIEVEGAAEQPVWVRTFQNEQESAHSYDETDADGKAVIEGVMQSDHVGKWREIWSVGRACALPMLQFEVQPAQ